MNNKELVALLERLGACEAAVKWVGGRDLRTAWAECERGDWMLWLAGRYCERKRVVMAACKIVRTALKYVPKGEKRPLEAIRTTERWCRGEASIEEVRTAAADATAAANATPPNQSARAAYAAAHAAYAAAHAAVYAANAAADAAYAAAHAADAAIVRKSIPYRVLLKAIKKQEED